MIDLQTPPSERSASSPRKPWAWVIGFVAVLLLVGYLVGHFYLQKILSTWSKQKIESEIGQNIHRQVQLGSVRWNIGLPGIVFHVDRITVNELNGKPFVLAGPTDIAVSLFPLINEKKLLLSHLSFTHPEIWATRLTNTRWNFSDLPELPELKDLRHLDVRDGKVHVTDARKPKLLLDFDSIEAKLDRPFYRSGWPFALSADLKHPKFTTHITMDGNGHGDPTAWRDNKFEFNTNLKSLVLTDFEDFTGQLSIPDKEKPLDASLSGEGVPTKGITLKASVTTPTFTFSAAKIEHQGPLPFLPDKTGVAAPFEKSDLKLTNVHFEYPQGKLSVKSFNGDVHLTKDKVSFKNAKGRFGHSEFEAEGWVDSNRKADVKYHGTHILLDECRQTADALKLQTPPVVHQPMFGTVKEAFLTLKGDLTGSPAVTMNATPEKLYYMPNQPKRLFELGGGKVTFDGTTATFENLTGRLGRGTFTLDGKADANSNGKVNVRLNSDNIDLSDVKTLLKEVKIDSPLVKEETLFGSIKSARGEIKGSIKNPSISLKVVPVNLYYQPTGSKAKIFEVNGGEIGIVDNALDFHETSGTLGPGKFWLNGSVGATQTSPLNLKIRAENMDLANVKSSMQAMKVQSPLLAEQLLFGIVNKVDLSIAGTPKNPTITMTAFPKDLVYEPLGTSRAVHLSSGKIVYIGDVFTLQDVDVTTPRSKVKTSLTIKNLSSNNSLVSNLTIDTPGFELGDLHAYLAAPRTPKMVRDRYLKAMSDFNISPPKGKAHGHLSVQVTKDSYTANGDMKFEDVSTRASGFPISAVKGHVLTNGGNLVVDSLSGNLGKSQFSAAGQIANFADKVNKSYDIKLTAQADLNDFINVIGDKKNSTKELISTGPVPVTAQVSGTDQSLTASFHGSVPQNQEFSFVGPFGTLSKPKDEPGVAQGTLMIKDNIISLQNVQVQAGKAVIRVNGTYTSPSDTASTPQIDVTLDLPNPIGAKSLVAFLPAGTIDSGLKNLTGSINGSIQMKGPTTAPAVKGSVHIIDFGVPTYKLAHVTGQVTSTDWVTGNASSSDDKQSTPFDVDIQSLTLNKLPVKNIKGKAVAGYYTSKTNEQIRNISLKDITADIAKGKLKMRGWTAQNQPLFGGTADLSGVDANTLFTELFDLPNEVTGTVQAHIRFRADIGPGKNVYDTLEIPAPDLTDTNVGNRVPSTFKLENGRVTRFSLLQRRIDQANLLKGGILDFNINNFLQSVAPVKDGNYKSITGAFLVKPGLKCFFGNSDADLMRYGPVSFMGDELRMRSSGNVDFKSNDLKVEVVGNIPRVSSRGFFGKAGSMISINGLLGVLDGLPIMPNIWPESRPRAFTFKINAPLDKPQAMNKSIYDSFKWIPNQKDATPHPTLAGATSSASG